MLSTSLCFGVVVIWSVYVFKNKGGHCVFFFSFGLKVCFEIKLIVDVLLEEPARQDHRYD